MLAGQGDTQTAVGTPGNPCRRRLVGWSLIVTLATIVALYLSPGATDAAPPWPIVFKQTDANPNATYDLTEANGPWTILAATFTGAGAEEQSQKLIHELRTQHKLPAYSYQKKFEFSKPVEGLGYNGDSQRMKYRKSRDLVEIAVLVGDYSKVDDPEAQKVLKKLKYLHPKALITKDGEPSALALADVRAAQAEYKQAKLPKNSDELKRGPMANAFVMTNPLLPPEYFVPKGMDELVVKMNTGIQYSLLDCPRPYTVRVATFTGHAILLDSTAMEALRKGGEPRSWLENAGINAHVLTEALRKKGYEAYEFHDRSASIVTIGSFDSVMVKRNDGKVEFVPQVQQILKTFGPHDQESAKKNPSLVGKPKKVDKIPLDVRPWPVEVPRRSIGADYARNNSQLLPRR